MHMDRPMTRKGGPLASQSTTGSPFRRGMIFALLSLSHRPALAEGFQQNHRADMA